MKLPSLRRAESKESSTEGSDRDERPLRESSAPLICALLGAALAGVVLAATPAEFPLDDAYIHLAYAKSLRLGDGLSYNPGDWETGMSSPLWVLLLAAWPIPTGPEAEPATVVKLLGLLFHALSAMAGAATTLELLAKRARLDRPLPLMALTLLGGALVAATPTALQGAVSGMEVSLSAALLCSTAWAVLRGRPGAAAILGGLAMLARPETLAFTGGLAVVLVPVAWHRGDSSWRAPVAAAAGSLAGLLMWMTYNLIVSGDVWPNPQYIKGGMSLSGLSYLRIEVLPWQPWLVSLTGLVLLGLALRRDLVRSADDDDPRRFDALALVVATVLTLVGIAVSRPLHVGVQFYESRYFAIVACVPAIVVPLGVVGLSRWLGVALVLPLAVLSGTQTEQLTRATANACADIHVTHTAVAKTIARDLPRHAVVGVEGAGATRYYTPRSMTMVDLIGLNDHVSARLHFDRRAKLCHLVGQHMSHLAIPAHWQPLYAPVFALRPRAVFDDPRYTQTLPPRPHRVVLYDLVATEPGWARRCGG